MFSFFVAFFRKILEMERGIGMEKKFEELASANKAFITVVQSICEDFIKRITEESNKNEQLQEENKELHGQIFEMEKYLNRGFLITEKEYEAIQAWIRKHNEEVHGADYAAHKYRNSGAIGGAFTYEFIPTSIGVIGTVRCSCGESFIFQNLM